MTLAESHKRERLFQSLSYHLPAQILIRFSGFIRNVLLARFLGPIEFGMFTMVQMAVVLIEPLAVLGQPASLIRFGKTLETDQKLGHVLRRTVIMVAIIGVAVIAIFGVAEGGISRLLFGGSGHKDLTLVVGFTVGIMAIHHLLYAARMGQGRFLDSSKLQSAYFILFTIIGCFAAWQTRSAFWASATSALSYLIIVIVAFVSFRDLLQKSGDTIPDSEAESGLCRRIFPPRFFPMLRYGMLVGITGIVFKLFFYLDRGILLHLENEKILGIYSGAMLLGVAVFQVGNALGDIIMPEASRLYDERQFKESEWLIRLAIKVAALSMTAVAAGIIFLRKMIMPTLFGSAYTEGGAILTQLVLFQLLYGLHSNLIIYIRLKQRNQLEIIAAAVSVPVNFLLCYYFVQRWGFVGVGWAVMIAMALEVGAIILINEALDFRIGLREWIACLLPFALLYGNTFMPIAVLICLVAMVATGFVLTPRERQFLAEQAGYSAKGGTHQGA